MLSILLVSKTGGTYENEKNKSRFEKEKLKSAFFVYRKNKAVFVAYPQKEKQNQERLFLLSERRDAECGSKK